jgi:hypothetical protein
VNIDFIKIGSLLVAVLSVVVAILAFLAINLPKRIEDIVDRKFLFESDKQLRLQKEAEWRVSLLLRLSARAVGVAALEDKDSRDKHLYVINALINLVTSTGEQAKHALEALRGKPKVSRNYMDVIIDVRSHLDLNSECATIYAELINAIIDLG